MNAVELLLKMDAGKLTTVPTGEMEIPRLSEMAGEPFIVQYKALSGRRIMELSNGVLGDDGNVDTVAAYDINLRIVAEALTSPALKDEKLLRHYKAATPAALAEIILLGGEIAKISEKVMALSGYGKDTDKTIKN